MKQAETDRVRVPGTYVETWTNAKAAKIGFHTGQGLTSEGVANIMGDGTSSATIRRMWTLWGITSTVIGFHVPLSARHRALIERESSAHGLSPAEWARRVLVVAAMDKMTEALDILDGDENAVDG